MIDKYGSEPNAAKCLFTVYCKDGPQTDNLHYGISLHGIITPTKKVFINLSMKHSYSGM